VVERILSILEVNSLTTYATQIANQFHRFYEKHRVVSNDTDITKARLVLAKATQITLKNTLDLLGVSAPEKM
jgi:arginyl-tRNA synthetase